MCKIGRLIVIPRVYIVFINKSLITQLQSSVLPAINVREKCITFPALTSPYPLIFIVVEYIENN